MGFSSGGSARISYRVEFRATKLPIYEYTTQLYVELEVYCNLLYNILIALSKPVISSQNCLQDPIVFNWD